MKKQKILVLLFFLFILNMTVVQECFMCLNKKKQLINTNTEPSAYTENSRLFIQENIEEEYSFYENDILGDIQFKDSSMPKSSSSLSTKDAHAIVIGVADYPGTDNDLSYSAMDADTIYSFLGSKCNFPISNIILLKDSDATSENINSAFNQIAGQIDQEDLFFFYYVGHGGYSGFSQYLCPYDSIPSNPSNYLHDFTLNSLLENLNAAEICVVIDTCFSGGMIPESQAIDKYLITSGNETEKSYGYSSLQHGVFTQYFNKSAFYATDSNADGVISMEEQYSFVYSNVVSYSTSRGKPQHPEQYDGISGETVLYPSFGTISFNASNNQLEYSFNVHGHGSIKTLNITACSVYPNITIKSMDLTIDSTTNTGFENYSGIIELNAGETITGYEIVAEIDGNDLKTIKERRGDYDGDGIYDLTEIENGSDPTNSSDPIKEKANDSTNNGGKSGGGGNNEEIPEDFRQQPKTDPQPYENNTPIILFVVIICVIIGIIILIVNVIRKKIF